MAEFPREIACPDGRGLAASLAAAIAGRLGAALAERGSALLAVSGGRSPVGLFQALSGCALDWSRVTVTLVDDRWVDESHPDSNGGLVRTHLLQGAASRARFVPLKTPAPAPFEAVEACERAIASLPLPFDTVVLGMGDDGHTASWFPGAEQLDAALDTSRPDLCIAVHPPKAPHDRMTLTLRGVLTSRSLFLELSEPKKLPVYRRALEPGPVREMPIRAVLRQDRVPLEVYYTEPAR